MIDLDTSIFKAYDVRGVVDEQLTPDIFYLIGRAYAQVIKPEPMIVGVGRDVRDSGLQYQPALIQGLLDEGVEVVDLGVISTDMLYFAVANYNLGGGLSVTASHNPPEFNGVKMVRSQARPISLDTGIAEIRDKVLEMIDQDVAWDKSQKALHVHKKDTLIDDYLDKVFSFVDIPCLNPLKVAFNANHGIVGQVVKKAIDKFNLPITYQGLYMEPDGSFPQGRPDPLYEANQQSFQLVLSKDNFDMGVAWDADADRCFFFDENGEYIHGYFTTAVLARYFLQNHPGEKVITDPRLIWAVQDVAEQNNGSAIVERVGHSFIKARMREENAIFAGESSGHYYFRDYYYADNGLIPFLIIWQIISQKNIPLSQLFLDLKKTYFIAPELNYTISESAQEVISRIEKHFTDGKVEKIDGLSIEYPEWRFNVRPSNTEPLLRVSVEAKNQRLVDEKVQEIETLIKE